MCAALCLSLALAGTTSAQRKNTGAKVALEVTTASRDPAILHWKIRNESDFAICVYDFFLWGPAFARTLQGRRTIFDTAPVVEQRSCPPNRFPPVLLLVVGAGRTIEGDFQDDEIRNAQTPSVSLRVVYGIEPYRVVEQAKRFAQSKCKYSPYDAIVQWGTVLESNPVGLASPE
jgi:hypothetical protein